MDIDLAVMLGRVLNNIGPELMMKHMKAQIAGDEERTTTALAQMVMYAKISEFYQEDDDYYLFVREMRDVREFQQNFYLESRAANDRKLSLIALSRLRFLGMLQRRLTTAEREKAVETLASTPSIRRH